MSRLTCGLALFLVACRAASPAHAADPPARHHSLNPFARSPFTAEFEVYSGAISGKSIGAAYDSVTRGDIGGRFTFGFMRAINFSMNYLYSNQTRSFTAVTPPVLVVPTGTALMRAANLNMFFGNGEINLFRRRHSAFYLSPGVGFARNGARSMTLITPLGTASSPIFPGTAVSFNLGAGVKIFPAKHIGFRIDARDFISGGGTGNLNSNVAGGLVGPLCAITCNNPGQFFGPMPIQNNLIFTLGLIFRIH